MYEYFLSFSPFQLVKFQVLLVRLDSRAIFHRFEIVAVGSDIEVELFAKDLVVKFSLNPIFRNFGQKIDKFTS